MEDMEFTKSPQSNLETWDDVKRLIVVSSVLIAIALLLMAAFLTNP